MKKESVNKDRRRFLTVATGAVGGAGAAFAAVPFMSYWQPSLGVQAAGGPVEVDITKIEPGARIIVPWRKKPVWVVRRTDAMLEYLTSNSDISHLSDPNSVVDQQPEYAQNDYRSIKPEFLVLIGICTHLGCSPTYMPELTGQIRGGGFYCPCHGSLFDMSGRVYKGVPAPLNMVVPPYIYTNDDKSILIGLDTQEVEV